MIYALNDWHTWLEIAQVIVILGLAWLFYRRLIHGTSAEKLVRGLFGLVAIWVGSIVFKWLGLDILGNFAHWIALFLTFGLIVIFQPELRKFLAMMGKVNFIRAIFSPKKFADAAAKDAAHKSAEEIVKATEYMSNKHIGALMVFWDNSDDAIKNTGTIVNADISSELLLTIFFPKTSLHDGAVILRNNRIYSAGAILPLTENTDLHWQYGTRHRAALGISEQSSGAAVLVVSEETGSVSWVYNGKLTKFEDMKKLRTKIEKFLEK